jgi:hypothetical protein
VPAPARSLKIMLLCNIKTLAARCRQLGYTLAEVQDCIVSRIGEQVVVDTNHNAYPQSPKDGFAAIEQPSGKEEFGPGAELKKLLLLAGIKATEGCKCNKRANIMNERGCDWCEENIETIVGWLREEAESRKLPFVNAAARLVVRRAIRNARKSRG